ncbi:MAG: tyrosine-type recombinase/integrase [Anaerolineales bacterium]|nr:tyrosine-type recombinase/integrase [Anaerolineales bacterium]
MNDQNARKVTRFLMESKYTDATKVLYRTNLGYWFSWVEACGFPLDQLDQEHVAEFLEMEHPKGYWSQASKYNFAGTIKAFYKWAYPEITHPITRIRVRKAPVKPRPFYKDEEIERLLDSFGDTSVEIRNKAIVSLAYTTGLRVSEICRLEIDDVNFSDLSLVVLVKGQRYETAIFTRETAQYLLDWLSLREQYVTDARVKNVFIALWGGYCGRPLTRHGLRGIFYAFTEGAGLERGSPHRFRHSCGNNLLENGANELLIQMGLRLKDRPTVARYTSGRNLSQLRKHLPRASAAPDPLLLFDPSRRPNPNMPTFKSRYNKT